MRRPPAQSTRIMKSMTELQLYNKRISSFFRLPSEREIIQFQTKGNADSTMQQKQRFGITILVRSQNRMFLYSPRTFGLSSGTPGSVLHRNNVTQSLLQNHHFHESKKNEKSACMRCSSGMTMTSASATSNIFWRKFWKNSLAQWAAHNMIIMRLEK